MIVARAPASTANLGPGFDAAAAALDLWNHVEIETGSFTVEISGEGADELPHDATHLAVQAFALLNHALALLRVVPELGVADLGFEIP